MNLKTIAVTTLFAVAVAGVMAQPTPRCHKGKGRPNAEKQLSAEEMAQKRTDMLATKLGLNDKQMAKLQDLNTEYAKVDATRRAEMEAKREMEREKREAIKAEMQERKLAVMALLTDGQKLEYAKLMSSMHKKGKMQRGGKPHRGKHIGGGNLKK